MSPPHQLLIRLAGVMHVQYAAFASRPTPILLPHTAWQECVQANRLLEYARRRGWTAAVAQMTARLRRARRALAHEIGRLEELSKPQSAARIPDLRDLYSELIALYGESDQVRIDRRAAVLAVRTEPIELEGTELGPFEIQLRWSELPEARCYSIIALQPHPSGSDGYVHPHVLNERLCEGEGRQPIQRALADGRLCDFFQIVNRILESYNPDSAYVVLDDWDGVGCSSCGDLVATDDASICSRCGTASCFECNESCCRCDDVYCHECVRTCATCGDVCCRSCLVPCPDCAGDHCEKCRSAEERCHECCSADTAANLVASPLDASAPPRVHQAAPGSATSAP